MFGSGLELHYGMVKFENADVEAQQFGDPGFVAR
jgi:hypothetical protein